MIRSYWRQRERLIAQRAEPDPAHAEDALEQMNVQIHKVLTDISGVSGMAIIRAIVGGRAPPQSSLRAFGSRRQRQRKNSIEKGSGRLRWAEHHPVCLLEEAVSTYDFLDSRLRMCDRRIDEAMARLGGVTSNNQKAEPARRKNRTRVRPERANKRDTPGS